MSSIYLMMKVKTFLPAVAVVILCVNTIEQNITFKTVYGSTNISSNSAATKFSINLHLFYSVL